MRCEDYLTPHHFINSILILYQELKDQESKCCYIVIINVKAQNDDKPLKNNLFIKLNLNSTNKSLFCLGVFLKFKLNLIGLMFKLMMFK